MTKSELNLNSKSPKPQRAEWETHQEEKKSYKLRKQEEDEVKQRVKEWMSHREEDVE